MSVYVITEALHRDMVFKESMYHDIKKKLIYLKAFLNLKSQLSVPVPQVYKEGSTKASVTSQGAFTCTSPSQTNPPPLAALTQFSRKVNMTVFKGI